MNFKTKILLIVACLSTNHAYPMETVFEWKYIDFDWPSEAMKQAYVAKQWYNYTAIIPGDINRSKDGRTFMSLTGTVATPARVATISEKSGPGGPLLQPFPDWSWYQSGTCDDIKSVVRTAIDDCNRLWVLDSGMMLGDTEHPPCPGQLLAFDLNFGDQLVKRIKIPREFSANKEGMTLLAFLAVKTYGVFCSIHTEVYMADVFSSSLIVYNDFDRSLKKIEDPTFKPDLNAQTFEILGSKWNMSDGLLGLTLVTEDPQNITYSLYYRPLASKTLYVMDVSSWKIGFQPQPRKVIEQGELLKEQALGQDYSPSEKTIFFGLTTSTGIGCWNIKDSNYNVEIIAQDTEKLQYPNGVHVFSPEVAGSDQEELWVFTNRYYHFLVGKINFNDVNFRVLKAPVRELVRGTTCDGNRYK